MRTTELKNIGETKAGLLSEELGIDTLEALAWYDPSALEPIEGLSSDLVAQAQDALPEWHGDRRKRKRVWCSDCNFTDKSTLLKSSLNELAVHRVEKHSGRNNRLVEKYL